MKLSDLNLYDIGNTIQISGIIYSGKGNHYCFFLPGELDEHSSLYTLDMSLEEWKKFIRQSDLLEVEIINKAPDSKLAKIILRKSARQVDQRISWKVYQRDNYTCQYCGATGIPLTIDHLVLWEDGGPTIEENLLTSCKKCNKTRGNMKYEDWLKSEKYKNRSKRLSPDIKRKNAEIDLSGIETVSHIKSR